MKGRAISWSDEELEWLEERRDWPRPILHSTFVLLFDRREIDLDNIKSLCTRRGWTTGRTGQFTKGIVPANKGRTCPEGVGGRSPGARRTQFRKGSRPLTFRGPGHERICNKDGYVILIVAETNPWSGAATRPVHKHRWLWEKVNGPLPKGHCLKCLDGDKTNTDPSNWRAVPRAVLARLNGGPRGRHLAYDEAAPELRPALIEIALADHAARQARQKLRA